MFFTGQCTFCTAPIGCSDEETQASMVTCTYPEAVAGFAQKVLEQDMHQKACSEAVNLLASMVHTGHALPAARPQLDQWVPVLLGMCIKRLNTEELRTMTSVQVGATLQYINGTSGILKLSIAIHMYACTHVHFHMHFFTLRPDNFTLNWMHTHTVAAPSSVSVQVSMMCAIASALFYNPILALQSLAALMPDNQAIIQVFHLWLQVLDKHHKMFAKKQVSLDLVPSGIRDLRYPLVVYTIETGGTLP